MKVSALVPLKLNSRRLPNKNFLRLGNRPLAYHIFDTLSKVDEISNVFCFTSQPQVLELLPKKVELLVRPRRLDSDNVRANELFEYAVKQIEADIIIICHATGPFVKSESIIEGLNAIVSGKYDCALSVRRHQTYCWYNGKALNYDPKNIEKTQNITPVYSETSGFYIFKKQNYMLHKTRIGTKPKLVEVDFKEAVDIDEPHDFALARILYGYNKECDEFMDDLFFVDIANEGVRYKNIKHLSFDLDGVLIDSLGVMRKAWTSAMTEVGLGIDFEDYSKHIGKPFRNILEEVGIDKSLFDSIEKEYDNVSSKLVSEIKVYKGVKEAIKSLKKAGLLISIVTSKSRKRTEQIMANVMPGFIFDSIVTPDDINDNRGKPNPDPLMQACLNVGVDPYNTVYVGDMESDRECSKRAGVHFIHAAWGYSKLSDVKDLWFDNIYDMIDYILE